MKIKTNVLPRIILLLLAIFCAASMPTEAQAAETEGPLTYVIARGKAIITNCNATLRGDFTIPATLGGCPVTEIGEHAFSNCQNLTSITIPDSVTSIGDYAFSYCLRLTSITIPDSVTSIGIGAFSSCSRMTSITIPKNVTEINFMMFSYCTSLTSITFPDNVTGIGRYAFKNCTSLYDITIPDNVTGIGWHAFDNCTNLTEIYLPASIKIIEVKAFDNCYSLTNVYFAGSQKQWNNIIIEDNAYLTGVATMHYAVNCNNGHHWDDGEVTKEASCNEEGVKTFTCTACDEAKTEPIAKLATHIWSICSVTQKATCKEEGVKTYTCIVCETTKTEAIPKLTTHTYDHACDTVCNVCGSTRTVTHQYSSTWSKSQTEHWHACTICGHKADQAAHTPGAAATETTAQTCTKCGYVIKDALSHTHNYETTWCKDVAGHWHACACGSHEDYSAHSYKNSCDTDCDICGYTRTTTHTPGPAATATKDQTCTVCGKVLNKATGGTTTTPPATEPAATAPATEPSNAPTEPTTDSTTEPVESTSPTESVTEPVESTSPTESVTEPVESTPADTDPSGTDATQPEDTATTPSDPEGSKTDNTIVVVIVACAACLLLGAGGAIAGIILWKKKH